MAGLCLISWIGVSPSLVFQFSRYASDLLKILLYHCTVPPKNEDEPCLFINEHVSVSDNMGPFVDESSVVSPHLLDEFCYPAWSVCRSIPTMP